MLYGLIVALAGFLEQLLSQFYYLFARRNHKFLCAMASVLRTYIWFYIIKTVINEDLNQFALVTVYAIASGAGDYLVLCWEPFLDTWIKKIKKSQARKRSWIKRSKHGKIK